MDNKVIQSLWIGNSLSVMERLSISSFLKNGHEFHLYTYGVVRGVPEGTVIKDAAEIIPLTLRDYRNFPKLAFFADMFRYKLLLDKGGWWVDTDTVCLRPFDFKEDIIVSSEAVKQGGTHTNNGNLKVPAGSPLMAWLWDTCFKKQPNEVVWGDTGPRLMEEAIKKLKMEHVVKPPETFCPVPWWEVVNLTNPEKIPTIPKEAYAVHLWNEQWQYYKECNKTVLTPGSLYAQLVERYDTQPDMSEVTAVIKTFLRDDSMFYCVKTLKATYPSIHIIVADDGYCTSEKADKLKAMGVDKYVELPWERGLSAGRNRLIEAVETPYILLCDDDFSFTPDCHIERLLELTKVVDIAGGLVYNLRNWVFCDTGAGWDVTGGNFITQNGAMWVDGTRGPTYTHKGIRYEVFDFILNFFVAKTETIRKLMWDERLKFSAEHLDFCLRAKAAGVKSGRCLDSYVLHKVVEDAFDPRYLAVKKDYAPYRELFAKKWGFIHPEHIPSTIPKINEPKPLLSIPENLIDKNPERKVKMEPPVPAWQEGFLENKVQALFKRFRYVVTTVPKSDHYKALCKIYPEHLEEKVDTPQGPRIIFIVEKDGIEKNGVTT